MDVCSHGPRGAGPQGAEMTRIALLTTGSSCQPEAKIYSKRETTGGSTAVPPRATAFCVER